jgi:hypothetical protein
VFADVERSGGAVHVLRPFNRGGTVFWVYHCKRGKSEKGEYLLNGTREEVSEMIDTCAAKKLRLHAAAFCRNGDGKLVAGATFLPKEPDLEHSAFAILSLESLRRQAGELGRDGFRPLSISGYLETDGTHRFCVVWVQMGRPGRNP